MLFYDFRGMFGAGLGAGVLPDGNPINLHFVMFLPTLMGQGSSDQIAEVKFFSPFFLQNLDILQYVFARSLLRQHPVPRYILFLIGQGLPNQIAGA